ncbi:MAG: 16S rRNA (cytidine(1402)-2'-O)-methyltransferase [Gammaproteobacteria bacterium]|nr:16S rRNA (cytidine(1402)-2'-O)-methyltransferase [Gammaproteobacteria bacterium]|tara:strand:- start:1064 stop:1909 length:846 start_codon:yes stop_codon:yes gene_type:complete
MTVTNSKSGTLYVIATPIGNLEDISHRAIKILKQIEVCAAEDTRKSRKLFNFFGIETKLVSYHKYSEQGKLNYLIEILKKGKNVGLISDAGTPLISDPGYLLIREASKLKITISPIPGASSLTASLSVSDLPVNSFTFYGFPPKRGKSRELFMNNLREAKHTSVIFESGKRIEKFLQELIISTPNRNIFIARELTKLHESFYRGSIKEVLEKIRTSETARKGEFVLMISGITRESLLEDISPEERRIIQILLKNLPKSQALTLGAEIFGISKNSLYKKLIP